MPLGYANVIPTLTSGKQPPPPPIYEDEWNCITISNWKSEFPGYASRSCNFLVTSKQVKTRLHKRPLNFNGCLDKLGLTSLVKYVTGGQQIIISPTLQWRHNERNDVSNHRHIDCLFNRLFRRRSKKTSELRVNGICEGNSPVISPFPTQRASDAENVSILWRHHEWLACVSP